MKHVRSTLHYTIMYVRTYIHDYFFLNQVHAGLWPARAWYLKIDPVWIVGMRVCVCVCPHPRLLITSGVMWRDIDLI